MPGQATLAVEPEYASTFGGPPCVPSIGVPKKEELGRLGLDFFQEEVAGLWNFEPLVRRLHPG